MVQENRRKMVENEKQKKRKKRERRIKRTRTRTKNKIKDPRSIEETGQQRHCLTSCHQEKRNNAMLFIFYRAVLCTLYTIHKLKNRLLLILLLSNFKLLCDNFNYLIERK